jgi:hypothetical protein
MVRWEDGEIHRSRSSSREVDAICEAANVPLNERLGEAQPPEASFELGSALLNACGER